MPRIIKDDTVIEDRFTLVPKDVESVFPEGNLILPLTHWLNREQLNLDPTIEIGVWLDSDEDPLLLKNQLHGVALVAINFPVFSDGRGYSSARLIRDRLNYQGELRAIGDVLLDQLFFMKRCGFNAYATRPDRCIETALTGIKAFSLSYQGAADNPTPLFRQNT